MKNFIKLVEAALASLCIVLLVAEIITSLVKSGMDTPIKVPLDINIDEYRLLCDSHSPTDLYLNMDFIGSPLCIVGKVISKHIDRDNVTYNISTEGLADDPAIYIIITANDIFSLDDILIVYGDITNIERSGITINSRVLELYNE